MTVNRPVHKDLWLRLNVRPANSQKNKETKELTLAGHSGVSPGLCLFSFHFLFLWPLCQRRKDWATGKREKEKEKRNLCGHVVAPAQIHQSFISFFLLLDHKFINSGPTRKKKGA